ncbi:class I (M) tRNA synthetase, partial [Helicosporidium sp. ATCC 50920]
HVLHAPGMRALSVPVRRCASLTEPPARPAETFVITTPLYYANDVPHIGSAYSTIVADVMARYQRLRGRPVCFITGTDEHGEKIAQAAESKGLPPHAHCDAVAAAYLRLWDRLDISYDSFVRTTDPAHGELVKRALEEVGERGDVFRGVYSGLYCVGCEEYKDAAELTPYCLCPIHLRPCSERHEDNYFFRLSRHREAVLDFLSEDNPGAIVPLSRANEARAAVQARLADFSISRAHATWGVPLPQDASQTVYVWFDALLGYLSALLAHHQGRALSALEWKRRTGGGVRGAGAGSAVDTYASPPSASPPASFSALRETLLEAGWPASVQVVGKDILRFHAIYWPGMLDSLGLLPPRTLVAHGLLTRDGHKMSKSLGNSVDPHQLLDAFGCEAVRFFLVAQAALGTDGDLSERRLQASVNAVLANGLGNLLHRALCLLQKLQGLSDGEESRNDADG